MSSPLQINCDGPIKGRSIYLTKNTASGSSAGWLTLDVDEIFVYGEELSPRLSGVVVVGAVVGVVVVGVLIAGLLYTKWRRQERGQGLLETKCGVALEIVGGAGLELREEEVPSKENHEDQEAGSVAEIEASLGREKSSSDSSIDSESTKDGVVIKEKKEVSFEDSFNADGICLVCRIEKNTEKKMKKLEKSIKESEDREKKRVKTKEELEGERAWRGEKINRSVEDEIRGSNKGGKSSLREGASWAERVAGPSSRNEEKMSNEAEKNEEDECEKLVEETNEIVDAAEMSGTVSETGEEDLEVLYDTVITQADDLQEVLDELDGSFRTLEQVEENSVNDEVDKEAGSVEEEMEKEDEETEQSLEVPARGSGGARRGMGHYRMRADYCAPPPFRESIEIKRKGNEVTKDAIEEAIRMMKEARTKEDAMEIVRKIEEHQLYLLDKDTEKLSSLVEANRMKPGVGEGRLLETALRLDFVHPEVITTALLALTRICFVRF
ncbi:hypothetical protein ACHWQZ_G017045 [Mnemiopsis leidyi]